ncbi:class II fructose-bisphosphate aldolase family protein [Candidatus Woesearchaeota archaeon]|nr:class II fructose-bisphosphate aldolase family protein [Candidatus Woesearchaeota archaeon]
MVLVSGKSILQKAKKAGYAVGAFNTNNLETTKAIIAAAVEMGAPIFLQLSSGALKYGGFELAGLALAFARKVPVPVAVHLDHGPSLELARECIGFGFSSVMIDGSALPFSANAKLTKAVAAIAHRKGVSVEAELGQLKGREDEVFSARHTYTDPTAAAKFVRMAGCDSLAVAIGTSHGAYKFKGPSGIDLRRLREIAAAVDVPLVLHGASSVPRQVVAVANKFGAKISNARGVPELQIRKAVRLGVCKVNEDTDLRLAFTAAVRKFLRENPSAYDLREILIPATEAMSEVIVRRINLLGSEGKA